MAFEVPAMQNIARAPLFLDKALSGPPKLLRIAPIVTPTVFRQSQMSDQLAIGPVLKKQRNERGLSHRELGFKSRSKPAT
jgi:hypothetical protein